MLSHANCGKYCSKRYDELRVQARNDETLLSTQEQDFAETANMPIKSINQPGQWEVETVPQPWYDKRGEELIDIRKVKSPIDRVNEEH